MSETAFLFPGQGSQTTAMLDPFADAWPSVRERLDALSTATEPTDADLETLLFDADADTLRDPANTQPAVLATSVLVAEAIVDRFGVTPDVVAGHSLGHVSAATVAGAFEPRDALDLVRARGELMAAAEREAGPGTMVAVLLAEPATVTDVVDAVDDASLAATNAPRQTVVSGRTDAVEAVVERLETTAPRARTVELDVGSGFHSPVMEPAVGPFAERLAETPIADPDVPIVSDVSAAVYEDATVAREELREQLRSPVRWRQVLEVLQDRGVERFLVLPPATDLGTLVERTVDATVVPIDDPEALEAVVGDA